MESILWEFVLGVVGNGLCDWSTDYFIKHLGLEGGLNCERYGHVRSLPCKSIIALTKISLYFVLHEYGRI